VPSIISCSPPAYSGCIAPLEPGNLLLAGNIIATHGLATDIYHAQEGEIFLILPTKFLALDTGKIAHTTL
jgi:hypothetical protein